MSLETTGRASARLTSYFSDEYSGLWVGVTTVVCTAVIAAGHLTLLAGFLGQARSELPWGAIALVDGLVLATAAVGAAMIARRQHGTRAALTAFGGVLVLSIYFIVVAWLSSAGLRIPWQPVVGASLSVAMIASLGGFYLASRRARTAIGLTFVVAFFVLFSYVMSLEEVNRLLSPVTGDSAGTSQAVSELFADFRSQFGLIIAFYFGTDAAVAALKVFRAPAEAETIKQIDRDLASPGRDGEGRELAE